MSESEPEGACSLAANGELDRDIFFHDIINFIRTVDDGHNRTDINWAGGVFS